ncbi:hypothetical protein [Nitrosomonas sp. Is37]|uniref:hypothetical protein n=1 Tax=Nitrosomonas sp. Is37 TaxID=3080535 RepID=UPI00294B54F9|nr:hypothetical protein [Nitrosomonas sp. Is37]MDV6343361.1 hypothetical protein [Nitrosomonas sp. Is37]
MQYDGLKYSSDHHDAFHLAHLMRLGILPTEYIYPGGQRAVRDLMRRRCVGSIRTSNGKKKGVGNAKVDSKCRFRAFSEAVYFALRFELLTQRFYKRKKVKALS